MIITGGADIDTEGGDGTFENVTVNGVLSGANLLATAGLVCITGTNETSAGVGDFRDTTHESEDIEFTTHLTTSQTFVYLPDVANAACFNILTVTDADNLELADSTTEAKNARAYGNGNPYWIIDSVAASVSSPGDTGPWVSMKEFSWDVADNTNRTLVVDGTAMGGKKRTLMLVQYNLSGAGAGTMTANYGDTTLTIGTNGDDGLALFVVLTGNNTLTLTKSGTTGGATATIWFDHVHPLAGAIT